MGRTCKRRGHLLSSRLGEGAAAVRLLLQPRQLLQLLRLVMRLALPRLPEDGRRAPRRLYRRHPRRSARGARQWRRDIALRHAA
jgi:hypothetical protein